MAKFLMVSIALIANAASAQIMSGTIIVINLTKDKVTVAADSRSVDSDTGKPNDSYCKISAFRNQFVFASSGSAGYTANSFSSDGIASWNNSELAGDSISVYGDDVNRIATDWGDSVSRRWNSMCAVYPSKCSGWLLARMASLPAVFFFGLKTCLGLVGLSFDGSKLFQLFPVKYYAGKSWKNCWPCGQIDGSQICATGNHLDVVEKFCSQRKPGANISVRTPLQGTVNADTKLPVKIVEMTIDAYSKFPGYEGGVGDPVDAITITKGSMTWDSLKKGCPENQ